MDHDAAGYWLESFATDPELISIRDLVVILRVLKSKYLTYHIPFGVVSILGQDLFAAILRVMFHPSIESITY